MSATYLDLSAAVSTTCSAHAHIPMPHHLTTPSPPQAMSATYLDRRRELLGSAFDMAAQLKLDGDSAHDGALLMDRTMSASLVLPEQQLLPALVACMLTAAAGGQAGQEAQLSAAAAAELLDLPEPEVAALQERIKEALSGDCSMLSALR